MVKDQSIAAKAARESMLYQEVSEMLNSISMASAFFVLCAVTYLRKRRKKTSNRVSLRLQSYVSMTDMFFAAFQIMTVNSTPPGNWVCRVSPWGFVLTALLGCFFSATIALNLQIIFVHNYLSTRHFEKYYVMVPLLLAFTLSTVPVLFNVLGYDEKEVSCWYKNGNTQESFIWQLATLHGWIVLSVLYCTCAVIAVINRLRKSGRLIMEMDHTNSDYTKKREYKRQLIIHKAVKRIVIYPIVPIITFSFNIISNLLFFTTKNNIFILQMMANIGTSSQGLFNAIAFCFDPAMKKIWEEISDKLFNKKKKANNNNNNNNNNNFTRKKFSDNNKNVINDCDDFDDDYYYDDDNENNKKINYHNSSSIMEVINSENTLNEDINVDLADLEKIENVNNNNNNHNDAINVISVMNVNDGTNDINFNISTRTSEDECDNILTLL